MNIKLIIKDRFTRWRKHLVANNATPQITIGIGHGRTKGKIVLCCTEDRTDEELILFLRGAANQLESNLINQN